MKGHSRPHGGQPWKSRLVSIAVMVGLVAVALWGVRWWSERPLADARRAYARRDWVTAATLGQSVLLSGRCKPQARLLIARSLWQLGRWEQAETVLADVPMASLSEDDLAIRGQGLLRVHWWPQAIDVYSELRARRPKDPAVLQKLTVLQFQVGKGEAALQLAIQLEQFPEWAAAAFCIQGAIQEDLRKPELAVQCNTKVLELDPTGQSLPIPISQVRQKLVASLKTLGRFEEAEVHLEQAIAQTRSTDLLTDLADVLFSQGKVVAARKRLIEALQMDKRHRGALMGLGRLALAEKQPVEAIGWLNLAHEAGASSSSVEYQLSTAHQQVGRNDLAEKHRDEYRRLVEFERRMMREDQLVRAYPDTPHALLLLARRALVMGDSAQAEGHLMQLLRQFPNDPEVQALLAEVRGQVQHP